MTRRLVYLLLFLFCTATVCCAPGPTLKHFHSKKPSAIVVPIYGTVSPWWGSVLASAFENPKCGMVVAWIESGGGSVTEVQLLEHRIRTLREKYPKPFWVFSERILASGAYWIACLADTIILAPSAQCGSIGVTYTRVDSTKLDAARGVQWHIFRSGEFKNMSNPYLAMSTEEYLFTSYRISQLHAEFVGLIVKERGQCLEKAYDSLQTMIPVTSDGFLLNLTQGAVYDARNSCAYGLVDKVMWFDEFMASLASEGFKISTSRGIQVQDFYPIRPGDSSIYRGSPIRLEKSK